VDRALFISDIHLSRDEAGISALFFDFLEKRASDSHSLYILGDLFDAWAGDDDLSDPFNQQVISALRRLSESGTTLSIMHGNRDFLMGQRFFEAAGATFIPDPHVVEICGKRTLLTHGDALCIADTEYQSFRKMVRQPSWQSEFLSQPLSRRKEIISGLRAQSERMKREKEGEIMDVDSDAAEMLLKEYGCSRMIHGHTHKPGRHEIRCAERWVTGDWHPDGAIFLTCEAGEIGFLDAAK
jgi:UDP-2,3-diacylglucosamine hydrolase